MKLFLCSLTLVLALLPHPYYVSICQIDHNPQTESLEISFKIFVDDLNAALRKNKPEKIWLGEPEEHPEADELLQEYLNHRVKMAANGEAVQFNWVGKMVEEDICWVFVEVPNVPKLTSLEISNRLLMEVYPTQENIVHVKSGQWEKSMTLVKSHSEGKVEF